MIDPHLQSLYFWDFDQRGNIVNIGIRCPVDIDPNQIKVELNKDKNSISVFLDNQPPIIAGSLFKEVTSIAVKAIKNALIIALIIKSEEPWPTIVIAPHKDTGQIDPLSSFNIFTVNKNSDNNQIKTYAMQNLDHAMSLGFYPALLAGYDIFNGIPEGRNKANEFLQTAAIKYGSHQAHFQLGLNALSEDNVEEAFNHFQTSSAAGNLYAKSFEGYLLSPFSEFKFANKNPEKAIALLEEVCSKTEDPTALHELAKLIQSKDHKKAMELQERAKKLVKDIPDLPTSVDAKSETVKVTEVKSDSTVPEQDPKIVKNESPVEKEKPKRSPESMRLEALGRKVDAMNKKIDALDEKLDLILKLLQQK